MFPGVGTLVNVVAVLLGATLGRLLGDRFAARTRDVVTDGLGLVTLVIAGTSAVAVADPDLVAAVGSSAPLLIVLGSVVLGGIAGSLLRLEHRLERLGEIARDRLSRSGDPRFVEGFVVSSLIFCTGPLTVVGSLEDGLGGGPDQLFLKSALDLFAATAFAATFGWGVALSAVSVVVVQGSLTLVGLGIGDVLPAAETAALGATGGVLLIGVALRLLRVREVPVVDLLPALALAPALTWAVGASGLI